METKDDNYKQITKSNVTIRKSREQRVGIIGIISFEDFEDLKGVISSNQTGGFPLTSRRGNKYILIIYNYDSNSIHAVAIPSRYRENIVRGYDHVYTELKSAGIVPSLHKLDNEVSKLAIQ